MQEKKEVLYLIIIQQQEQQIKAQNQLIADLQLEIYILSFACLIYLLFNALLSYWWLIVYKLKQFFKR